MSENNSDNYTDGIDRWRKARKKPVEVEFRGPYTETDTIETIEGDFEVDEEYIEEHGGYVIIRGIEGEVYPCGLDIFRETYEQGSKGRLEHEPGTLGAASDVPCENCQDGWYHRVLGLTEDTEYIGGKHFECPNCGDGAYLLVEYRSLNSAIDRSESDQEGSQ